MVSRCLQLNDFTVADGECVVYVMSRDQRVADNYALLEAQALALQMKLPLVVVFCLQEKTGFRAREHYQFMIDGLKSVESELKKYNIGFHLLVGSPLEQLQEFMRKYSPAALYFDFSPLKGPRAFQKKIGANVAIPVHVVDTHNIVPIWLASNKQEYAARTIRPKINNQLSDWITEPKEIIRHPYKWGLKGGSLADNKTVISALLKRMASNGQLLQWKSGEKAAHQSLQEFIECKLGSYGSERNDPNKDALSNLSPYLHFGQISSLRVVLKVIKLPQNEHTEAFLEELIIRKELSDNFCFYNPEYKSLKGAPAWAQKTLSEHQKDPREFQYSYQQLDSAFTHDELWNAAQQQLVKTGKMHGYLRMYWAKKVLEWTENPQQAIDYLVKLNDFYSIDGGDPNGYVGILWSVAGLHDRPWFNRSIYGSVRYMSASGASKKFDTKKYIDNWA